MTFWRAAAISVLLAGDDTLCAAAAILRRAARRLSDHDSDLATEYAAARIYRLILDAQPESAESVITVDDAGVIRVRDGAREEIQ